MATPIHAQHLDVQAAGQRLHVQRLLPKAAELKQRTIVFLHEGLGSISQWGKFPAQLCAKTGLPGLVYDRWGYGRSQGLHGSRPSDYLHHEAEHSLPELLAACGITEPPILFGHSDGASIALLFAATYPERTCAVISEAGHVSVEDICLAGIRCAGVDYATGSLRSGLQRHHGENVDLMFQGWHDTWLRPSRRAWNIENELRNISCPVLIIQGQDDEYGTRAQVDAIAAHVSGTAQIAWLPNCGHTPHAQLRDNVLDIVVNFLRDTVISDTVEPGAPDTNHAISVR